MLVDTHCHIHDARFDEDRALVIKRARDSKVQSMVTIGCDLKTTYHAQALSKVHPDVYFSAGYHPHEAKMASPEAMKEIESLARQERCVAVGECGLDFYYDHSPRDLQVNVFEQHMELSKMLKKTLVVHVRDAYQECIDLVKGFPTDEVPVVIHCFTGTLDIAKKFLDLGCYLSISGIATFKDPGKLKEVIAFAPLEKLLVETDSPYLAPLPHRGKRNEPSYVVRVAEALAQVKSMDLKDIAPTLTATSNRVFQLG